MAKAYIEIVSNEIGESELPANKVSLQWDKKSRIHFLTDMQDVYEQQKSDFAAGISIDQKQKDAEEGFELGRYSVITDKLTRQNE